MTRADKVTEQAQRYVRLKVMRDGAFHPADLLLDETLSIEEKVWILEQRVQDMTAELRAAGENMTRETAGDSAERLRDAQRTLLILQSPYPPGMSYTHGHEENQIDTAEPGNPLP